MNEQIQKADLATVAVGMASEAVAGLEQLQAGKDAAKYALSIVVTDDASKLTADDALVKIARARKAVEAARMPITRELDAAKAKVMDFCRGLVSGLDQAEAYLGEQVKAHLVTQRRKAEAERAAEAERQRKAEAARRAAEEAGRPAPPPPVARYVPPVTTSATMADGSQTYLRVDLKCELVNPHECDPSWLKLDTVAAMARGRLLEAAGDLGIPREDGASAVVRGVRYFYVASMAKRT